MPRLNVLISSTSVDLELHRHAVRDVLLEAGHHPVMMEQFGTEPRLNVVEYCRKQVLDCDLVIVLIAKRYGTPTDPKRGGDGERSYTHMEVDEAREVGRPFLVFMADDDWPGRFWDQGKNLEAVQNFRNGLGRLAKFFNWDGKDQQLDNFKSLVRTELARHLINGSAPTSPDQLIELRQWSPDKLPSEPYPLIDSYSHPSLFAGRDRELEQLERKIGGVKLIVQLYATSGAGKSSLLRAGIVPRLRHRESPVAVALERNPAQPGVAARLVNDLLQPSGAPTGKLELSDRDQVRFVEWLAQARQRTGQAPVLIIDQFEELFRVDDPHALTARRTVGILLAATAQRQPGLHDPLCRWVLAYRQDAHDKVDRWLANLFDGAGDDAAEIQQLPSDLSKETVDWPLPLFGSAAPGDDPRAVARQAFRAAIDAPLEAEGASYLFSIAAADRERLADAFARKRIEKRDETLVPALQVVLSHLLETSGFEQASAEKPIVVTVPDDVASEIDEALTRHLARSLDRGAQMIGAQDRRRARATILVALRELVDADGQRTKECEELRLSGSLGPRATALLDELEGPRCRVIQRVARDGTIYVRLTHDRLAEAVLRLCNERSAAGELEIDPEILAIRELVADSTALHQKQRDQALMLSKRDHARVKQHREQLPWDDAREAWWQACEAQRAAQRRTGRMRASMLGAVLSALLLALVVVWREGKLSAIDRQLKVAEADQVLALFREARHYGAGDARLARMLGKVPADAVLRFVPISRAKGVAEADQPASMLDFINVAQTLMFAKKSPNLDLFGAAVYFTDYLVATTDANSPVHARAMTLQTELRKAIHDLRPRPVEEGLLTWVSVRVGQFEMGSKQGADDERPVHWVTISRPFQMTESEITVAQWNRFDQNGKEPDSTLPKANVSWFEAYAFAAWVGGRLPTEAEWEYACRAGSSTNYSSGERPDDLDLVGWYDHNSGQHAHDVKKKDPNGWGLYDMHGNLWEWVVDAQYSYSSEPRSDPWLPPSGGRRVVRGGSFALSAGRARSAFRSTGGAGLRGGSVGFRVVRPAPSES